MKTFLFCICLISFCAAKAQKIDSIYVNLYTDSLKKGTYNYINVDGLLKNGRYLPLDSTRIAFTCDNAKFFGNTLFIPADFRDPKVKIRVALREDMQKYKEFEMYIKTMEDPPLKTEAQVMEELKNKIKKNKKKATE